MPIKALEVAEEGLQYGKACFSQSTHSHSRILFFSFVIYIVIASGQTIGFILVPDKPVDIQRAKGQLLQFLFCHMTTIPTLQPLRSSGSMDDVTNSYETHYTDDWLVSCLNSLLMNGPLPLTSWRRTAHITDEFALFLSCVTCHNFCGGIVSNGRGGIVSNGPKFQNT